MVLQECSRKRKTQPRLKHTMIKIAHITTTYQSIVRILDFKLQTLDKFKDLDITAISSPPDPSSPSDMRKTIKPTTRFIPVTMSRTIKPWADLKSIWQLYKILKREKFDIVQSHTSKAGFITPIAAKMAQVPLILHTCHGMPFWKGQNKIAYFIYRFLDQIACIFRDHLLSQNKADMAECIKLMRSESKVTYEGNGVDIEAVHKYAEQQLPQAEKDYPCKGLRVLLISRLIPVKRVDDFLEVINKLKQDGIEVSCVIVGTGFLERQVRNQLIEMRLDEYVNMVGFVDYPPGLIAASDIVLLCSEKEGIPRSLIEAMTLRRPVVGTDVAGTQELIVNGKTGFLVPLGDTEAMAEKIKILVKDPELRKKMGECALKRVRENFNDIKVAELLHEFYITKMAELKIKKSS